MHYQNEDACGFRYPKCHVENKWAIERIVFAPPVSTYYAVAFVN